jgi:hypothetical protein
MATFYNITGYQGDYLQLTLNLKDSNGAAVNLSGYGVRGQVRASYGSTGVLLDLNPTISGNGLSGIVSINVNSYISADLPVSDHIYDIERYPSGVLTGNSIKLMRGKFTILPEVTR